MASVMDDLVLDLSGLPPKKANKITDMDSFKSSLSEFSFDNLPAVTPEKTPEIEIYGDFPMGVYKDMPNAHYHSTKAISSSGLGKLNERSGSPAHLGCYLRQGMRGTPALDFGNLFHDIILMSAAFVTANYLKSPKFNLRSNAGKEEKAEFYMDAPEGVIIVDEEQWAIAEAMKASVMADPCAAWLINEAKAELGCENSHFWVDEETGNYCRVRPDIAALKHGILGDLKSTADCTPYGFQKSIFDYNYHQQQEMYRDGVKQTTGTDINEFWFIATEKQLEKPVTVVYKLDGRSEAKGREDYRTNMALYADLMENDNFHAPKSISLPAYAFNKK